MFPSGTYIGRYLVQQEIGKGGMARVYEAFDDRLERSVAIKVILPGAQTSEEFLKRFEREARALGQLSHPNIVKVLDYGEQAGAPYLVMENISGGTLKDRLTGMPTPWQEAFSLILPIARSLEYAHRHGIVHRDVKPLNILMTESGDPMLSDFGIAKLVGSGQSTDLTGTGVGIGTPHYMAPEQGLGKPIDARVDVYALGVMLFEMISGQKPFDADTPMAVVLKHVSEAPPRLKNSIRGIPDSVERIIQCALAKDPAERIQTAQDMIDAMEATIQGEGGKIIDRARAAISVRNKTATYKDKRTGEGTSSKRARGIGCAVTQFLAILTLVIIMVGVVLLIGGTFVASQAIRAGISQIEFERSNKSWTESITLGDLNQAIAQNTASTTLGLVSGAEVILEPPENILLDAQGGNNHFVLRMNIRDRDGRPVVKITHINNLPLLVIGPILAGGINTGLDQSLDRAGYQINNLQMSPNEIIYDVSPENSGP